MFDWDLLTILAILSACVALYILYQSMFQGPAKGLEKRMQEFANQAVEVALSEYRSNLDYSVESLSAVDRILETIHLRHKESAIPERELSRIVLTWGGYLGTVLKKRLGGNWQTNSSTAGNNTYPLHCKSREAIPVMWCLQRIRRGSSASIIVKTNEFLVSIEPGSPSRSSVKT